MIQCRGCGLALTDEDNYCRRCGAAVRVVEISTARAEPSAPALPNAQAMIAASAAPLATGVAAVAAGALVRFAVRQAIRAFAAGSARSAARGLVAGQPRALAGRDEDDSAVTQITEVFWYRRVVR